MIILQVVVIISLCIKCLLDGVMVVFVDVGVGKFVVVVFCDGVLVVVIFWVKVFFIDVVLVQCVVMVIGGIVVKVFKVLGQVIVEYLLVNVVLDVIIRLLFIVGICVIELDVVQWEEIK